ncbi:hypothetical protein [Pseudoflavonifractor sp. AF19-9AC]|uniref:hypothetical protein n=1 Tax=Pseudoflavonifractor sp. AF19-9AC TaxID=2292244 RepID=UPI0018F63229|nr:hypothetical protein [Pseudoflavonifractor sp. AF19-9AC]
MAVLLAAVFVLLKPHRKERNSWASGGTLQENIPRNTSHPQLWSPINREMQFFFSPLNAKMSEAHMRLTHFILSSPVE